MQTYSLTCSRRMAQHLISLFFWVLVSFWFESCKTGNDIPPMTAEDQIENSGDPGKFLAGEYFTHELNNFTPTGRWETSDDPEGYGQVAIIKSRYFLTLTAKGKDSLSVSLKGDGGFGPLMVNLGSFSFQANNSFNSEYLLKSKARGFTITRITHTNNTLYVTSRFQMVNGKGENMGYIGFRRVSKGIVRN